MLDVIPHIMHPRSGGKDFHDNSFLLPIDGVTHRYSVPRIWLEFDDSGIVTDLHQTHIEGGPVRPRSSVPDCRPN